MVTSLACRYTVPPNVNPSEVRMQFTPSAGPPEEWNSVADINACTADNEFYYDDPNNPGFIHLCPLACDRARNDIGATVEFLACLYD